MTYLEDLIYLLKLNLVPDVFWNVLPLIIATIITVIYFQKYSDERPGWNSYMGNSLILLFVGMALLRYLYGLNGLGAGNYIGHYDKSIAIVFLLLIGMLILRFNFEHLLPEVVSRYISSPLSVNLIAFMIILYTYSERGNTWGIWFALLSIFIGLNLALNALKFPLRWTFNYIEKLKAKEIIQDVKEEKFEIEELKKEIEYKEKRLKNIDKRAEQSKKISRKIKKIIKS